VGERDDVVQPTAGRLEGELFQAVAMIELLLAGWFSWPANRLHL
jgi:hypothetical protein